MVLPCIIIRPDPATPDTVTMTLNGQTVPRPIRQAELGALLSHVVDRQAGPVRIEVHESNGTVHADILSPHHATPQPPITAPKTSPPAVDKRRVDLAGFLPGEDVHIAVVIATRLAEATGRVTTRLPRRARRHQVVVFGTRSGTTVVHPS